MRSRIFAGLIFAVCLALPLRVAGQSTVTFDFDTGTPSLSIGQGIPIDQTSGGTTAHFSSPNGSVFSIQSDASTGWHMSQFSGHYLYDNNLNLNPLDIKFSQSVTSITLTFATADFQQVEVPTTIQLTAYVDSTSSPPVGAATAHGTYGSDTMPMGTLTFSAGAPFNLVEITIPTQPLAASDYFVDNIIVTLAPPQTQTYMDQTAYLSAISGLVGSSVVSEGFENATVWGSVRAPSNPNNVVSNGVIWSSNHPYAMTTADGISTSATSAHSGSWGAFSSPHGDPDAVKPTDSSQDGLMGTLAPGQNLLYAAGCWVSGNLGGNLVMILDGDELHAVSLGAFSTTWQFFGLTSTTGFSRFELRDTQGIVSQSSYVFVDDCTLATKPPLTSLANVSSASLLLWPPQAVGGIGTSFGVGLATATEGMANPPLPTTMANMTISVKDSAGVQQQAALYYASPSQINYLIPDTAAVGAATVSVSVGGQVVATGPLKLVPVAPSIYTVNMNGVGPPAAYALTTAVDGSITLQWVFSCGTAPLSCIPAPLDLGPSSSETVLLLFGTGIKGVSSLSGIQAQIGAASVPVQTAGPDATYPGLDIVTLVLPHTLAGSGQSNVVLTVDGIATNAVQLSFK